MLYLSGMPSNSSFWHFLLGKSYKISLTGGGEMSLSTYQPGPQETALENIRMVSGGSPTFFLHHSLWISTFWFFDLL